MELILGQGEFLVVVVVVVVVVGNQVTIFSRDRT